MFCKIIFIILSVFCFSFTSFAKNEGDFDLKNNSDLNLDKKAAHDFIEKYLIRRHEILQNLTEQEKRWGVEGFVFKTSSFDVYNEFLKRESYPLLSRARTAGLITRQIKIIELEEIYPEKQIWQATMRIRDSFLNQESDSISDWVIRVKLCDDTICKYARHPL